MDVVSLAVDQGVLNADQESDFKMYLDRSGVLDLLSNGTVFHCFVPDSVTLCTRAKGKILMEIHWHFLFQPCRACFANMIRR